MQSIAVPLTSERQRVEWNTGRLKEAEEAKKVYLKAKQENRLILNEEDKPVETFAQVANKGVFIIGETELKETEFSMRVFNETGDSRLIWDSAEKSQVEEAKDRFNEYISNGWRAYAIKKDGTKSSRRIYHFDAELEEIYFDDQKSVKEKLKDFIKEFKEIKMVPKTYPG